MSRKTTDTGSPLPTNSVLLLEDDLSDVLAVEMVFEELKEYDLHITDNIAQATQLLTEINPSVIIADLYLKDGVNSLNWLASTASDIPTIILSSNYREEYFARALTISVRSYLMKPVNPVTLKFELEKLFVTHQSPSTQQKIVIKDGTKFHVLDADDIIWIEAEGNYSTIKTSKKKIVIKTSLNKIFKDLNRDQFIQVRRSVVVALNKIKMLDSGADEIITIGGDALSIGRTYKVSTKDRLRDLGFVI